MSSVNKVFILGNVGRDPEIRYLQSGMAACSISVATSTKRKDKQSGEMVEETQWHRVQFFDRLAEVVGEYVKKGSKIHVEGRLRYGKFTNKDGVEQNSTDIIASEMTLLSSQRDGQDAPQQRSAPPPAQRNAAPRSAAPQQPDFPDDDIPF